MQRLCPMVGPNLNLAPGSISICLTTLETEDLRVVVFFPPLLSIHHVWLPSLCVRVKCRQKRVSAFFDSEHFPALGYSLSINVRTNNRPPPQLLTFMNACMQVAPTTHTHSHCVFTLPPFPRPSFLSTLHKCAEGPCFLFLISFIKVMLQTLLFSVGFLLSVGSVKRKTFKIKKAKQKTINLSIQDRFFPHWLRTGSSSWEYEHIVDLKHTLLDQPERHPKSPCQEAIGSFAAPLPTPLNKTEISYLRVTCSGRKIIQFMLGPPYRSETPLGTSQWSLGLFLMLSWTPTPPRTLASSLIHKLTPALIRYS